MTKPGILDRDAARATPPVDPTWTIDELLRRRPDALPVLNAYGVECCCGAGRSLADAAREDGVDLTSLLADLQSGAA